MTQYINKSALVAEIERLVNHFKTCQTLNSYEDGLKEGRLIGYEDALYKINALKVKDVDLEKEFYDFLDTLTGKDNGHLSEDELFRIAEYFFELGLNTQKGE